jgi:hypothetical protein
MSSLTLVMAKEVYRLWQSIRERAVECRSRLGSFAMTNSVYSLEGGRELHEQRAMVGGHGFR